MDGDSLQVIVAIILIIAFILLAVTPVIAIWIYIFYQNSKRKKIVQRMLAGRADLIGTKRWFPARYASQQKFDSLLKFFPWNGAGVIIVVPGSVMFLGETLSGTPLTLQFAPGNSRINWLGKCPWPNGMLSWLRFDTADQKHYFSSETGLFIFGSHQTTKAIYDEANQNFGAPAAQNL
ncbi:MAG TPA: hypothetical protein VJV21_03795 [Pyrinomonadaceae bacterium]|nr:hypothetical protein [Pyrinomonadaceae bacterium]